MCIDMYKMQENGNGVDDDDDADDNDVVYVNKDSKQLL